MPNIILIAAISSDYGIGKDNQLLWSFKSDLDRFKKLTVGRPVIMGHNTYKSIGKALPARYNIVLSGSYVDTTGNVFVERNLSGAMALAHRHDYENEVFVIGGSRVYRDLLPFANKQYLTFIHGRKHADVYYPRWADDEWQEVPEEELLCHEEDRMDLNKEKHFYCFKTLVRKNIHMYVPSKVF